MAIKVYKEDYSLISDPRDHFKGEVKEKIEIPSNHFQYGFIGDVCWILNLEHEFGARKYIFNDYYYNMVDYLGYPIGNKDDVSNYLRGIQGPDPGVPLKVDWTLNAVRANQDHGVFPEITMPTDGEWYVEMEVKGDINDNSQIILGSAVSGHSKIGFLSGGKIQLYQSSSRNFLSPAATVPTFPSSFFVLKVVRRADNTTMDVYVNGELVWTSGGLNGVWDFDYLFRYSSGYFDGACRYVDFNGELFTLSEGTGTTTTSNRGRVMTLNALATPENMWVKA